MPLIAALCEALDRIASQLQASLCEAPLENRMDVGRLPRGFQVVHAAAHERTAVYHSWKIPGITRERSIEEVEVQHVTREIGPHRLRVHLDDLRAQLPG